MPVLIEVSALAEYVACPIRFAFKRLYGVVPEVPTSDLWAAELGEMFVWMHSKALTEAPKWESVLNRWESKWGEACVQHKRDLGESRVLRNRGVRHLLEAFQGLQDASVLAVRYPCTRQVGPYVVEGNVDVIRAFEPETGRRTIELIHVDPVSASVPNSAEASRRVDYVMAQYGCDEALRHSFRKAGKVRSMVYVPKSGQLGRYLVHPRLARQALLWVQWVVESIESGHFYPRPGTQCRMCPYARCCDLRHVTSSALEIPEQTLSKIRSALCPQSQTS